MIWEKIENSNYFVSICGKIKSPNGLILRGSKNQKGYLLVEIGSGKKKRKCKAIHSIVAETFLGVRPQGHQINHIDGNKGNNSISNLEYITCADNIRHSHIIGLHKNRLSPKIVLEIDQWIRDGKGSKEIADVFNVRRWTVNAIKRGERFGYITGRRHSVTI